MAAPNCIAGNAVCDGQSRVAYKTWAFATFAAVKPEWFDAGFRRATPRCESLVRTAGGAWLTPVFHDPDVNITALRASGLGTDPGHAPNTTSGIVMPIQGARPMRVRRLMSYH